MKARVFFCFVALLSFVTLPPCAQSQFVKTIGGSLSESGDCVIRTSDGGYVVTGCTKSFGVGLNDLLLAKFDVSGNHLWTRTLGGGDNEQCPSVVEVSDGGFVVTGATYSFAVGWDDRSVSVKYRQL